MTPIVTPLAQRKLTVPGDKSISHRALMLSGITAGESRIDGLADNADVRATQACLQALGVGFSRTGSTLMVHGRRVFSPPDIVLDAQNSGTTMRLLSGILAAQPFACQITGDTSLQKRPMRRIITPLTQMGASITANGERQVAPLNIQPAEQLRGMVYTLPHASAQVKSAILLTGLYAEGDTHIIEPVPSRDHTERMLSAAGVKLQRDGDRITLPGSQINHLKPQHWHVPGDLSSAAFWLVAASGIPGSSLTLEGVNLNPGRTGILDVLAQAGASIHLGAEQTLNGEPVGNIIVSHQALSGDLAIEGDMIPRLIDELPILAVAGTLIQGSLTVRGAEELRQKESDRIAVIVQEFAKLGIAIEEFPDGFRIRGPQQAHAPAVPLDSHHDHRIAMSLMVLNRISDPLNRWPIEGREWAGVSYPTFEAELFEGVSS